MNLSKKKLKDLGNALNNSYVPNNIPGFSVLVNQDSKEIYYSESGLIDVNRKRKINRDSIFRIYSMTKPITSISIMMLLEQGLININDDVEKFIPEWENLRYLVPHNIKVHR